jgi:hypothetical protein
MVTSERKNHCYLNELLAETRVLFTLLVHVLPTTHQLVNHELLYYSKVSRGLPDLHTTQKAVQRNCSSIL